VVAAAVLVGTSGCGPQTSTHEAAPSSEIISSATSSFSPPVTTSARAIDPSERSCYHFPVSGPFDADRIVPNPAAPPYAGQGPHTIGFGGARESVDTDFLNNVGDRNAEDILSGREWDSYGLPLPLEEPAQAQLILCTAAIQKRSATPIGTCEYLGPTVPIYPATYKITVMENRTQRVVATLSIDGDADDNRSCPVGITYDSSLNLEIGQAVKPETVITALRPVIMNNAG
jgi:hypothetical protein